MAVRKYKPTTPGRRGASVSDVRRDHPGEAREVAASPRAGTRPGATRTAGSRPGTRAAATSGGTGSIDFRRNKDGVPAKVAAHRVRPEPQRADRPAALRRRREALHPRAEGLAVGDRLMSGPDADIRPGNALPLAQHPGRHGRARGRAEARRRSQDGPLRRHQHPAAGEGGPLRDPAAPSGEMRMVRRRPAGPPSATSATPSTS